MYKDKRYQDGRVRPYDKTLNGMWQNNNIFKIGNDSRKAISMTYRFLQRTKGRSRFSDAFWHSDPFSFQGKSGKPLQ